MLGAILATCLWVQSPTPAATTDGVQIRDVKLGEGLSVRPLDVITVSYRGTLTNGTEFDASKPGQDFRTVIGAGKLIRGWETGLIGMKPGGERHLVVPPQFGYGDSAVGDKIPANSALVFDIKLINVERAKIETLKKGDGPEAKVGDTISVHYLGKLANGQKFDSSYDRKAPLRMPVGQGAVIPGFDQALLGMKKGEKRRVTIPPALGYRDREVGPIPPNSTLVFELECTEITNDPD